MSDKTCMICGSREGLLQAEAVILCCRCAQALHDALEENLQKTLPRRRRRKNQPQ